MDRAAGRRRSVELLERTHELEQIDGMLHEAVAGAGGVLVIEGPPGIGKTTLVGAARRRAQERGLTVLGARGGELEGQFPYGVVRQLFEPALRRASPAAMRELLSGAARLAEPVLAGESEGTAAGDSADGAFASMHGLYWLTVNLSLQAPILIAVDDAQWSDQPSLRFLLYLVRRLEGVNAGVLISSRSGEHGTQSEFAAQLAAEPLARVLRPGELSEHAIAQLLVAGLGDGPDDAFTAACRLTTGGVPFLVHELVAALVVDGIEPTAEQAAGVQRLGPRTVARVTLGRLGRMSPDSVALARAVTVLAGDAELPRAARLAGLGDPQALTALDTLVEAQVLQPGAPLQFVHPILRAAIYDELAPGARSLLHRRAAGLLSAEGAELDAIAAQLLASEPTGSEEVIAQLREAAARALARGAPENGVAYLSRALAEGCNRGLRAAISLELGKTARVAGQPALMVEQFEQAYRLADEPVLRNHAALELAAAQGFGGDAEGPAALLGQALDDLGDRAPELRLRLECLLAGISASHVRLVADFDRRLPALRELANQNGAASRSLGLLLAAASAFRGGDPYEVAALVEHGWDRGAALDSGIDRWLPWQGLGALVLTEQLERALELSDALLADAQARGSLLAYVLCNGYRGWIESRQGRLAIAEGGLRAALAGLRERNFEFHLRSHLWFASDVILERPEAADLAALTESVKLAPAASVHTGAMVLEVRGRTRHAAGQAAAAIDDLRHAGEVFDALGFRNPNATSWRSTLALMLGGEDGGEAHRLVCDELEDARRLGQARAVGVSLRALGLLEGAAHGRERLEQAVSVLERSPARLELARALVELGAARRRGGERSASREPLSAGLDLAVAGGATRLAERARVELAAAGARPRRERVTGRDALTASELRVARLAAEGRTNNEIAQALFVTSKTVDTHLSHVYGKLGISSRRAIAGALATD